MPIYELRCAAGHRFEVIQSLRDALPACPSCGAGTVKVPSRFGISGAAASKLPPPAERMPQTWRGTYNGDRDYLTSLQRTAEIRRRLEQRNPELAGDSRPIVAHEGRYEGNPLRAGDPGPQQAPDGGYPAGSGPDHRPDHRHGPPHNHPH